METSDLKSIIMRDNEDVLIKYLQICLENEAYTVNCSFELKVNRHHELLPRIKSILKRSKTLFTSKSIISAPPFIINCTKRYAMLNNQLLDLTNTEFNILEILIQSPGQAFSKAELTEYALGRKFTAYDRSIDVHISHLRNKLKVDINSDNWIKTLHGFGYVFNARPEQQ